MRFFKIPNFKFGGASTPPAPAMPVRGKAGAPAEQTLDIRAPGSDAQAALPKQKARSADDKDVGDKKPPPTWDDNDMGYPGSKAFMIAEIIGTTVSIGGAIAAPLMLMDMVPEVPGDYH